MVKNITSAIIGGVLLALIFFFFSDVVFKLPNLNGMWTFEATTTGTSYIPYDKMKLTYLVLLIQEGNTIYGTGEKVKEITPEKREVIYNGKERIHIELRGHITKHYFASDEITFHISEAGSRKSSTVHSLKTSGDSAYGTFVSTVATSSGEVVWMKGAKDYKFSVAK